MAKPYRLTPLGEADLEEIWHYTLKNWSMEQADSHHQSPVTLRSRGLAAGTKQGRPSVLPDIQKYMCGSHVAFFLGHADHLDVIRVLHQRQDTERHL